LSEGNGAVPPEYIMTDGGFGDLQDGGAHDHVLDTTFVIDSQRRKPPVDHSACCCLARDNTLLSSHFAIKRLRAPTPLPP